MVRYIDHTIVCLGETITLQYTIHRLYLIVLVIDNLSQDHLQSTVNSVVRQALTIKLSCFKKCCKLDFEEEEIVR